MKVFGFVVALWVSTAPAFAASTAATPEAARAAVRARFDHAQALADKGDAESEFVVGVAYDYALPDGVVAHDPAKAVYWFAKAAAQGHHSAELKLAEHYYMGDGVTQDDAMAESWARKAAAHRVYSSDYTLGEILAFPRKASPNYAEAAVWLRQATDHGLSGPAGPLGALYINGLGVPRDPVQGYRWFLVYLERNNSQTPEFRAKVHSILTPLEAALPPAAVVESRRWVTAWLAAHPAADEAHAPEYYPD